MREGLVDTDIFSEILEAKDPALVERSRQYFRIFRTFTVSSITIFEITKGLEHRPKPNIFSAFDKLRSSLTVLPVEEEDAVLAGVIHGRLMQRGLPIGEMDPLIAATAMNQDLILISGNRSHYSFIAAQGFPINLASWRS